MNFKFNAIGNPVGHAEFNKSSHEHGDKAIGAASKQLAYVSGITYEMSKDAWRCARPDDDAHQNGSRVCLLYQTASSLPSK